MGNALTIKKLQCLLPNKNVVCLWSMIWGFNCSQCAFVQTSQLQFLGNYTKMLKVTFSSNNKIFLTRQKHSLHTLSDASHENFGGENVALRIKLNCGHYHMSQEEHWPVRELQASIINSNLGKPSIKKTIFLLTFVNKDFTPPPPP